tara:strand:+ start:523 stop:1086 length:564 start_codon:yes stop_codon:yes gene_type:complete
MCDIAAGVMGTLGILGNMSAYAGQKEQAEAQNYYMAERQAREAEAIKAGYNMTLRQASDRYTQERAAVASQVQQVAGESRKAVAMSQMMAAERGVQGASIDAVFNDFERTEMEFVDAALQNLEFKEQAIADQVESARLNALNNLNNTGYMPVPGPDFMSAVLGAGTSALNAYYMFQGTQQSKPTETD